MPLQVTFNIDVQQYPVITITKDNSDPARATVTYKVVDNQGGKYINKEVSFTATGLPAALQTQLENLITLALNAAKSREGIP